MILLDCMCGAGGCTKGYEEAGFDCVGVDLHPMPNYCGSDFIQADALVVLRTLIDGGEWLGYRLEEFAGVHASPPCPRYANVTKWRGNPEDHPDLVAETRDLLNQTGLPWVMENVKGAPLQADFVLCGSMFSLPFQRHRYFETNWAGTDHWGALPPCGHHPDDYSFDHGGKQPESVYRDAMGVPWMTVTESRQAIPPAYCKHIGEHLAHSLEAPELEAA